MQSVANLVQGGPVARRHHAVIRGKAGGRRVVFGHGFGCDQTMWRHVAPSFEHESVVVVFDHAGCGAADPSAYDLTRHRSLVGYAEDLLELLDELGEGPSVFVGHSASAMIGVLASIRRPNLFDGLVLVGGSPRYLDDDGYSGGFSRADVDGFLESMESNFLGWAGALAPVVMANPDRPQLTDELVVSFARTESRRAVQFGRAIFLSDYRHELPSVTVPTLIMQTAQDPMVPPAVADYLHRSISNSALVHLEATGHFPHVSGPDETVAGISSFLATLT